MRVTLMLSTPERPEPHVITLERVYSVRYTSASAMLDMLPGLQLRQRDCVHHYALNVVLDVLVFS